MKRFIVLSLMTLLFQAPAYCLEEITLQTLNVDAERGQIAQTLPIVVESIASATVKDRYITNANDLLRVNPSVNLLSNSKGMTLAPEIRGFSNEGNLVLLDGTPVNTPWGHFSNLTFLPFRNFTSLDVIKSSESILYGANGLGGAINIGMPHAEDLEGFRTKYEYSDGGNQHYEASYGYVSEDKSNQHLFGFSSDTGNRYQQHTDYKTKSFMYRGKVELDHGYTVKLTSLNTSGSFEQPDKGEPTGPFQEKSNWQFMHNDISVERELDNNQSFTFRFFRNDDIVSYNNFSDNTYTTITSKDSQTQYSYGTEMLYNFDMDKNNRISMGVSNLHESLSTPVVVNGKQNIKTTSAFISDRIKINEKLQLQLAYRKDDNSAVGAENTWSATSMWKFAKHHLLTVSGGQTQKFPSARELYQKATVYKDPISGKWIYQIPTSGDKDILSEKSQNFEIHWGYDITKTWNFNVGYYKSIVSDYIERAFVNLPPPNPKTMWKNLKSVDIDGWETRLSGQINKNWDLQLGYTRFLNVNDTTSGNRIDLKHTYKLSGNIGWKGNRDNLRLFVEMTGHAPYEARAPKGVFPSPASYMTDLPSSTRVDLSWQRKVSTNATLFANIKNLTDADIQIDQHSIGLNAMHDVPRTLTMGIETRY